jgi:hypothetical protein
VTYTRKGILHTGPLHAHWMTGGGVATATNQSMSAGLSETLLPEWPEAPPNHESAV